MMFQVNYNRLLLNLHCPPIEYVLFPRLVQVIKKYRRHFNEKPKLYDDLIGTLIELMNLIIYIKKI